MSNQDEERRKLEIELGRLSGNNAVLENGWNSKGNFKSHVPRLPPLSPRDAREPKSTLEQNELSFSNSPGSSRSRYGYSLSTSFSPTQSGKSPFVSEAQNRATERSKQIAALKRGKLDQRKRVDDERINGYLATQRSERAARDAKRMREKNQKAAAIKIQCKWRQTKAKDIMAQRRREHARRNAAAVSIQSGYRQFKARQERQRRQDMKRLHEFQKRDPMAKSVSMIEDDEPLTLEEIASLTKQFRLVDADNSGGIDRLEFAVFYNLVANGHVSRRECDSLFDTLDADGSGALSLAEFLKVYKLLLKREAYKTDPREAERLRRLNERLAAKAKLIANSRKDIRRAKDQIDADRRKTVTRTKSMASKSRQDAKQSKAQREAEEKKRLEGIQAEKDREARLQAVAKQRKEIELFIHKAEVRAQRQDTTPGEMTIVDEFTTEEIETLRRQFQKVDTDNSGTIDKDEFAVFYNRVSIEQVSHMEGVNLFKQLDVDGSGGLTFDEFVSVYDLLQQRERARKDPSARERQRKMDEALANKAALIARARKDNRANKLEASIIRRNRDHENRALHNSVLAKRASSKTKMKTPSSPKSNAGKKEQFQRRSTTTNS